jgi:zinc protease
MKVVRTKHGYAYGVGGGVFEDDPVGLFVAVASTKTANTTAALEAMRSVITNMLEEKPSEAELETAKRDVLYTFATRMDNPREIVWQWLINDFYGFPPDYLLHYPARVSKVTDEDVVTCARRYIKPNEIRYYLVGACDALRALGTYEYPMEEWSLLNFADEPTTH